MKPHKHRPVLHVMAIDDRIKIRKILGIDPFCINRSWIAFGTVNGVIQIIGIVIAALDDRIIDLRIGYLDPRIDILVRLL